MRTENKNTELMFSCGKRNRSKSDISKVAKMAEGSGGSASVCGSGGVGGGGGNGGSAAGGGVGNAGTAGVNNHSNNCTSNSNNNNHSRRTFQRFSCTRCCNDLFNYLLRLRVSPEELEQRYKSREIDKYLEKDKHTFRRQVVVSLIFSAHNLVRERKAHRRRNEKRTQKSDADAFCYLIASPSLLKTSYNFCIHIKTIRHYSLPLLFYAKYFYSN